MKKPHIFITILIVVVSILFASCNGSDRIVNLGSGYYYDKNEKIEVLDLGKTLSLEKCEDVDEDFTLPTVFADGKMIDSVGEVAFLDNEKIVSVVIPDGYKYIGPFSFMNCTRLESVYIGKDVQTVTDGAFEGCSNIKNFVVSDENPYYYSKDGCLISRNGDLLIATNGTLPNDIFGIYASAFRSNTNLNELVIHDRIEQIGAFAFMNSSLTKIELKEGLKTIGERAFSNTNLKEIYIPSSVNTMGENIFDGVKGITINCAASEKPENWSVAWLDGCVDCIVNWGA